MLKKSKSTFNKTDWLIIGIYCMIVIAVSIVGDDPTRFKVTLVTIVFTLVPIYILMKFIFPITIEKGKYIKFFALGLLILPLIGYFEIYCYKVINNNNWNMKSFDMFYYALQSQSENIGTLLSLLIAKRFYETKLDLNALEKEMKINEIKMLKSQIDPHFLFNNLNTVDNLIDNNPSEAKNYLNQLSKLYRYLIATKDEEVVPLNNELTFINHYIYLINTRFGEAFVFKVNIPLEIAATTLIPPGALQGLLENAVKHNMATPQLPIITEVTIDQEHIIVSNNIKERLDKFDSTGNGLENINSRYKLLIGKEISIEVNENYTVKLPIIENLI